MPRSTMPRPARITPAIITATTIGTTGTMPPRTTMRARSTAADRADPLGAAARHRPHR